MDDRTIEIFAHFVMVLAQEDTNLWKTFEGHRLDGQFPLESYLGLSEGVVLFATRLEGQEQPVLARIIRRGAGGWEQLSASWALAEKLQHPNLVRVYATGLAQLNDVPVAYAISEHPDASLATVLQQRHLSAEEGRSLVQECTEALRYLHGRGLVHGRVQPDAILSVGETTKLVSDSLMQASQQNTPAADLQALQDTISRATGQPPPAAVVARSESPRPKPFLQLKYAIPAVAILLLVCFWLAGRNREQEPAPIAKAVAAAPPSVPQSVPQAEVDRTREVTPVAATPKPSAFKPNGNWLVVVYTYARTGDAEHKAAQINDRHPDLEAHVLAAKSGSPHLVVLGNGTDKDAALKLRDRARAAGLPRDSYVQNF